MKFNHESTNQNEARKGKCFLKRLFVQQGLKQVFSAQVLNENPVVFCKKNIQKCRQFDGILKNRPNWLYLYKISSTIFSSIAKMCVIKRINLKI
jgi:hypothetical protein